MIIISGGQTGADRGALDAAQRLLVPFGGWVPKGRVAEDGVIPDVYGDLKEHPSPGYRARTESNVTDSDATLVIAKQPLSGGSKLTVGLCRTHEKPCLVIDAEAILLVYDKQDQVPGDAACMKQIDRTQEWLIENRPISTLNVAGSRESKVPGLQRATEWFVAGMLGWWRARSKLP